MTLSLRPTTAYQKAYAPAVPKPKAIEISRMRRFLSLPVMGAIGMFYGISVGRGLEKGDWERNGEGRIGRRWNPEFTHYRTAGIRHAYIYFCHSLPQNTASLPHTLTPNTSANEPIIVSSRQRRARQIQRGMEKRSTAEAATYDRGCILHSWNLHRDQRPKRTSPRTRDDETQGKATFE